MIDSIQYRPRWKACTDGELSDLSGKCWSRVTHGNRSLDLVWAGAAALAPRRAAPRESPAYGAQVGVRDDETANWVTSRVYDLVLSGAARC